MDNPEATVTFDAKYDDEAAMWYVAESTYPGLHTEASSLEQLLQRARDALEGLCEVNGDGPVGDLQMRVWQHA